jgi:hypothetical protein
MRSTSKARCQAYQTIGDQAHEGHQNRNVGIQRQEAFAALLDMDHVAQPQALQKVYSTMLRRAKHRS